MIEMAASTGYRFFQGSTYCVMGRLYMCRKERTGKPSTCSCVLYRHSSVRLWHEDIDILLAKR